MILSICNDYLDGLSICRDCRACSRYGRDTIANAIPSPTLLRCCIFTTVLLNRHVIQKIKMQKCSEYFSSGALAWCSWKLPIPATAAFWSSRLAMSLINYYHNPSFLEIASFYCQPAGMRLNIRFCTTAIVLVKAVFRILENILPISTVAKVVATEVRNCR